MLKKMKKAFTITELVIVIAVIAILAAVLIPTFTTVVNNANESAAMQETKSEWTNCSAEIITTVDASSMNYLIIHEGYAFVVLNGNLEVDPVQKDVTAKPTEVTTASGTTYTVVDGQVYGFDEDGTTVTESAEAVPEDGYAFSSGFEVYSLTLKTNP